MRTIVLLIAALLTALGLTGVLYPEGLMGVAKYSVSANGILIVGAARVILGALLFLAARGSRTPKSLRVIGTIIFLAGIGTFFIKLERAQSLINWWLELGPDRLRMIACLPLAVGLFVGGSALFHGRKS